MVVVIVMTKYTIKMYHLIHTNIDTVQHIFVVAVKLSTAKLYYYYVVIDEDRGV